MAARDGPAVSLTAYWPTSPANTGDFGATLRREAVSSRIRANLKSARLLSRLAHVCKNQQAEPPPSPRQR